MLKGDGGMQILPEAMNVKGSERLIRTVVDCVLFLHRLLPPGVGGLLIR